jgi:hypothetical protein
MSLSQVVVALALFAAPLPPAQAAPTAAWAELADRAYAEAALSVQVLDNFGESAQVEARDLPGLASYAAWKWGWEDERTRGWLRRILSLRKPDGGYGLGRPWDWNKDGTTNPASTSYSITTAWQVGPTLLAGFDARVVPASALTDAATSLLDTPVTAYSERCVSYSTAAPDAKVACVWNVNAGAAWFLWEVAKRELLPAGREDEAGKKFRQWRDLTRSAFKDDLGGWTYQSDTKTLQDASHNIVTVDAMAHLDEPIAKRAVAGQLKNWAHNPVNLSLLKPGLTGVECADSPKYLKEVRDKATTSYKSQHERLTTRHTALVLALLVVQNCD